jgi:hypothetical protein
MGMILWKHPGANKPALNMVLFFLASIACALAFIDLPGAEETTQHLVISGDEPLGAQARHLRQIYPEIRAHAEDTLGWKFRSPPGVLLVADRGIFEKMSGNPLISAFAVPSQHLVVIHLPPATSEPYLLHETFEHELCHLLLHEHIPGMLLPRWLDEGICQWLSGSLGEILVGRGAAAGAINPARHLIALQQLAVGFPQDKDSLIQAYAESRLFVEYLVAHYGKESLLQVLQHLREGLPIDQALSGATSKSLRNLEDEWLEELRSKGMWLLWIGQNLYELLFLLAAILTIVAFVRLVIRKKRYDPDEEDER